MSAPALASPSVPLSPREAEVCLLLIEGLALKEIAFRLGISTRTAECHRVNIYRKLRVHSRDELVEHYRPSSFQDIHKDSTPQD
jgi:DNA-binding CsgD family transcriptional regulator